jgi:hypothetical protein
MELLGTGNSDYELIIKLEEHFIALNNYYNNETKVPKGTRNDQVCCTIEERHSIKRYAYIIKSLKAYKKMRLVDIYSVLIYTYYSLNYNEQTTDWLTLSDLSDFITHLDANGDIIDYDDYYGFGGYGGNPKKARALYFAITVQDIPYIDSMGIQRSLSSEIRRSFLELAEGKKKKVRKVRSRKVRSRKVRSRKVRSRKVRSQKVRHRK